MKPVRSWWPTVLDALLRNPLIVCATVGALTLAGALTSPFDWEFAGVPRAPVPVDAIPNLGENQQIVFTQWRGHSPQDIEDQVTYPLTTALLGLPGVRTVRSTSMFGFSSIYVIFEEEIELYWSRSRLLEKLASLPEDTLPAGVSPVLGPDATALGQVYWYTLEGRDQEGQTLGGWDLHELRSIQDWTVRLALQSVPGVAEVSSIGGYVREYQIDVDPDAMRAHDVTIQQVAHAVRGSNLDTGARTMEINQVEYVLRGVGLVGSITDLEQTVIRSHRGTPTRVADVARVSLGPAERRGALDYGGAETVGGVVVARIGTNPKSVIAGVKKKLAELGPSLPERVLEDGSTSRVTVVPFYDRSALIDETLLTLSDALLQQILITVVVILLMLGSLRGATLVSSVVPIALLLSFVVMKALGVDANVMSLGGLAIAIGTMVDMGIVVTENIAQRRSAHAGEPKLESVRHAVTEIGPAVLTATATTLVSFLPVFALASSEGKLFRPLAFTKTAAVAAAALVAITLLPILATWIAPSARPRRQWRWGVAATAVVFLGVFWRPLDEGRHVLWSILFVAAVAAAVLGTFAVFRRYYPRLLVWCLDNKGLFAMGPTFLVVLGLVSWLGLPRILFFVPDQAWERPGLRTMASVFPGLGREFMPTFDEGTFLFMPSTLPHASFGQSLDLLRKSDAAIAAVPEVTDVVGKLGRVESALDPAPVSMFETMISYKPEYGTDSQGRRIRQWRDHIRTPDDIWREITQAGQLAGLTGAPKLMPISTRIVMLQSGLRAPLGLKVSGPSLRDLEEAALAIEPLLREVEGIRPETVYAERVEGKPYLEIIIDREAISRYGLTVRDVQEVIELGLGGQTQTRAIEGRERYSIRVRYQREERDSVESLIRIPVTSMHGESVLLGELARVEYAKGPQSIKSENTFLVSYITFDKAESVAEVEAIESVQAALAAAIDSGTLQLPAGVTVTPAGTYTNQLRSEQYLRVLVPLALVLIFLLLYLQFRSIMTVAVVYTGVVVAVAGGFVFLWLYGQPWFLNLTPINMSVAVWVGVVALVGIATDDGVVMATYLRQAFAGKASTSTSEVRSWVLQAAQRRIRPCLMTTATTLLALLPVVMASGRGADLMRPMALPILGGMLFELMTLFVVPVLYCAIRERRP